MNKDVTLAKILILYDVLNQYTCELKPSTRQILKSLTKKADDSLRLLVKEIDRTLPGKSEAFGEDADMIRELIDKQYEK